MSVARVRNPTPELHRINHGEDRLLQFHYERDVHRVQLVKYINALAEQPVLNSQEWEQVRRGGNAAIQKWINIPSR